MGFTRSPILQPLRKIIWLNSIAGSFFLFKPRTYVLYSNFNKDDSAFKAFLTVNPDLSQTIAIIKR